MSTIDLLPEELRNNDSDEKKSLPKNREEISYVYPKKEARETTKEKKPITQKKSFFSRLFSGRGKKDSTKSAAMHIPSKSELRHDERSVDLLAGSMEEKKPRMSSESKSVSAQESVKQQASSVTSAYSQSVVKRLPKPSLMTRFTVWFKKLFPRKERQSKPQRLHKHSLALYKDRQQLVKKDSVVTPTPKAVATVTSRVPTDTKSDTKDEKLKDEKPKSKQIKVSHDKKHDDVPKYSKSEYDVNLIPREMIAQRELAVPRRITLSSIAIAVGLVAAVIGYFSALAYRNAIFSQAATFAMAIEQTDASIVQQQDELRDASQLQNRLESIGSLLDNHMYWTLFFEQLEEVTHQDVYFAGFSMAGTESVSLSGFAPSYSTVAEQLVAFQQADEFIDEAVINSVQAAPPDDSNQFSVSFRVDLKIVPGIFVQ